MWGACVAFPRQPPLQGMPGTGGRASHDRPGGRPPAIRPAEPGDHASRPGPQDSDRTCTVGAVPGAGDRRVAGAGPAGSTVDTPRARRAPPQAPVPFSGIDDAGAAFVRARGQGWQ